VSAILDGFMPRDPPVVLWEYFFAQEHERKMLNKGIIISRSSREILQEQRQDTESGDATVLDSLQRTKELGYQVKEALEQGDLERFGLLLDEHWQNKKRRSRKISDPHIDRCYEIAKESGALGGKVIGAGGGGFLMLYCPVEAKRLVRAALGNEGLQEMPFDFDFEGAKVLVNF